MPAEYFHTYLQSLDAERAGLSETFRKRLARALGHYGVPDGALERTPELEEAVFRIFLAQQRGAADAAVVAALLREWIREGPPGAAAGRCANRREHKAGDASPAHSHTCQHAHAGRAPEDGGRT